MKKSSTWPCNGIALYTAWPFEQTKAAVGLKPREWLGFNGYEMGFYTGQLQDFIRQVILRENPPWP